MAERGGVRRASLPQLLDLPGGPGGAEHAAPVEAGREGAAAHHRGGGGQLPRDTGPPADPAPSVPLSSVYA